MAAEPRRVITSKNRRRYEGPPASDQGGKVPPRYPAVPPVPRPRISTQGIDFKDRDEIAADLADNTSVFPNIAYRDRSRVNMEPWFGFENPSEDTEATPKAPTVRNEVEKRYDQAQANKRADGISPTLFDTMWERNSEGNYLGSSQYDVATPEDNPYDIAPRWADDDGYTFEGYGLPVGTQEAEGAMLWYHKEKARLMTVWRDEFTGMWMDGTNPATEDQVADKAILNEVLEEIQNIGQESADWKRAEYERVADYNLNAKKEALDRAYAIELEKAANARDKARMEQDHKNDLDLLTKKTFEDIAVLTKKDEFDHILIDKRHTNAVTIQTNEHAFQSNQNNLNRAIRENELDEAASANRAIERNRDEQQALAEQSFQLETFMVLARSPEMLYFMGNSPSAKQLFGNLLGRDGVQVLTDITKAASETPKLNIQQYAQLSGTDQSLFNFGTTAQTGQTDVASALRGTAPLAAMNQQSISSPISIGG